MANILMIGPAKPTRGGITAVIKEYRNAAFWNEFSCKWIGSYVDRNIYLKMARFISGYLVFLYCLPSCKIVHIHLSERISALRKSFFFWPAYFSGKKIILHFHAYSPETSIRGKYRNLYKRLFARADAIIVLSDYWKREIISEFGTSLYISVIHNPISIKPPKNTAVPEREPYILYAGILDERKGYKDLIKAFSKIAALHDEWHLLFAGNGDLEAGRKTAALAGIGEKVYFKGWVSGAQKNDLFRKASIFCLPSYAEGFPMSVLEAWSYGLPVITTPVGGLSDILVHRHNSMVFQPGEINELSLAIKELITDTDLRLTIGKNSLELIRESFNTDLISGQISSLYNSLLY